jgi:hypothetical protein
LAAAVQVERLRIIGGGEGERLLATDGIGAEAIDLADREILERDHAEWFTR